jgi:hypothetical protein
VAPDIDRMARDFNVFGRAWRAAGRAGKPRLVATHFFALGPDAESRTRDYIDRHYTHLAAAQRRQFAAAISPKDPDTLRAVFRAFVDAGATDVVPIPMIAALDQLDRLAETLGPECAPLR